MPVVLDGTSGITSPGEQVNGNLNVTGSVTAGSYVGIANGQLQAQLFTSPGTWTKPSSATAAIVTVIAGGQGANAGTAGQAGGMIQALVTGLTGPVAVTIGTGGGPSGGAGTSSTFGSFVTATGGGAGASGSTTGTTLKVGNTQSYQGSTTSGTMTYGRLIGASGQWAVYPPATTTYSTTNATTNLMAGAGGASWPGGPGYAAMNGAVSVEFVG